MRKFKAGDYIKSRGISGAFATVIEVMDGCNYVLVYGDGSSGTHRIAFVDRNYDLVTSTATPAEENAVSPNVYKFPNAEVRDISAHLTGYGSQVLQYVARATRLDGLFKEDKVQDLEKAKLMIQWEIERLQALQETK